MPRIYKHKCLYCSKSYEGRGTKFCCPACYQAAVQEAKIKKEKATLLILKGLGRVLSQLREKTYRTALRMSLFWLR
jgi:uncharacterized UBP type Zn finger protein